MSFSLNKQSKSYRAIRNESGQSIVLVSVVIMSFLLFFSFVINTGILVTAKISLQTAADAAAYAGAATQARYLNSISYLNYDMRRQYKKFIFKYVFLGNFGKKGFPNPQGAPSGGNSPKGYYSFPLQEISSSGSGFYATHVPVVCVPIPPSASNPSASSDACITLSLPNTANSTLAMLGSTGVGMSSLGSTLISQLQAISNKVAEVCQGRGILNQYIALQWLFRGDLRQSSVDAAFDNIFANSSATAAEKLALKQNTDLIIKDLGVFPKNLFTYMRIKTLEQFLNVPPQKDITFEKANTLQGQKDAELYERTILAYQSALHNLNQNVFSNPEEIILTELQAPKQIELERFSLPQLMIYVQRVLPPASGTGGAQNCVSEFAHFPVKELPVGVKKVPGPFVHYAVKLQAKAKLFAPGANIELDLSAVSGAKPFGSRIGPENPKVSEYVEDMQDVLSPGATAYQAGMAAKVTINDCNVTKNCISPNLSILSPNTRSFTQTYLAEIWNKMTAGSSNLSAEALQAGMLLATAPSTLEVGQYNILPPPPSGDDYPYEFIPYWSKNDQTGIGSAQTGIYRFYAPIFASGGAGGSGPVDPAQEITKMLDAMFLRTSTGTLPGQMFSDEELRTFIYEGMLKYVQDLQNPSASPKTTENHESLTFAAIEHPMQVGMQPSSTRYWLTKSSEVLTSWGPGYTRVSERQYSGQRPGGFQPRFGFSVKFTSLGTLFNEGMPQPSDSAELENVQH